jgi:hypothetical protein
MDFHFLSIVRDAVSDKSHKEIGKGSRCATTRALLPPAFWAKRIEFLDARQLEQSGKAFPSHEERYGGTGPKYCYSASRGLRFVPLHHGHNVLPKHKKRQVYTPSPGDYYSFEMKFFGGV